MVFETHLYDVLTVPVTATPEEITKSYKRLALRYHPDKTNHDPDLTEKFKDVTRAYEVLKDPQQRKAYDAYGTDGLDGTAAEQQAQEQQQRYAAGPSPFAFQQTMFSQFFNDMNTMFMGGMPFQSFSGQSFAKSSPMSTQGMLRVVQPAPMDGTSRVRGDDIHHKFKVTLEDMYYGKEAKFQLPKMTKCTDCNGFGCMNPKTCGTCLGSGRVVITMTNQFSKFTETSLCGSCRGSGTIHERNDVCKRCDNGYLVEKKIIKVNILPGSKNGDRIILRGQSDEGKNVIPGDVIIHLEEVLHPFLVRKFDDLYMEHEIDLKTALLGGRIVIHDFIRTGEDVIVSINTHGNKSLNDSVDTSLNHGEIVGVINADNPKIVRGLGMPISDKIKNGKYYQVDGDNSRVDLSSYRRGDLFIRFKVKLPTYDQFAVSDLETLLRVLPGNTSNESFGSVAWEYHLTNLPGDGPLEGNRALSSPMKLDDDKKPEHALSDEYDYDQLDVSSLEGEEELEDEQFYGATWSKEHDRPKKRKQNNGSSVMT